MSLFFRLLEETFVNFPSTMGICQLLQRCPSNFIATAQLLWVNVVKALLAKIWFKRNQRVFKDLQCPERFAPGIPCLSFS